MNYGTLLKRYGDLCRNIGYYSYHSTEFNNKIVSNMKLELEHIESELLKALK